MSEKPRPKPGDQGERKSDVPPFRHVPPDQKPKPK